MGMYPWNFCSPSHQSLVFTQLRSILVPIHVIALFTPTIVNELGYSAANAQLLTVPPFAAGCFFTIFVGIYSDKYKLRGPVVIGGAFVSLIGYIVLYTTKTAGAGYAGAVLAAVGVFPTIAVDLAWAGGNAGGDMKRGIVIAMVVGLGSLGGFAYFCHFRKEYSADSHDSICSSFVYIDPPRFHIGHGTV
jgi:MFS family permease